VVIVDDNVDSEILDLKRPLSSRGCSALFSREDLFLPCFSLLTPRVRAVFAFFLG
jgi:hypothetical protein